ARSVAGRLHCSGFRGTISRPYSCPAKVAFGNAGCVHDGAMSRRSCGPSCIGLTPGEHARTLLATLPSDSAQALQMIQITLPDGSQKSFEAPPSVAEVAQSIGSGLAKATLAGRVDDQLVDASHVIAHDARLEIVT